MRPWFKWTLGSLVAMGLVMLLAGSTYEAVGRAQAIQVFPPPGQLIDIGNRRIQLDCRGRGAPTVIFESGLDTLGSLSWSAVHDQVALTSRACAYSRAGVMWSDRSYRRFSAAHVAQDLHAALVIAGERAPYVMVGHSLGGPYLLTYSGLYPSDVAGLVFVDASHPDQRARLTAIAGKPLESGVGMAHLGRAVSGSGILRLIMPQGTPPPGLSVANARSGGAWFPQSVPAAAAELDGLDATLTTAGRYRALGDRPLVVLTRGEKSPPGAAKQLGIAPSRVQALDAEWLNLQSDEASWSTTSRHQVVPGASHYIQLDQPQAVIAAVNEVVAKVRAGR